jgi:hypothetical protein
MRINNESYNRNIAPKYSHVDAPADVSVQQHESTNQRTITVIGTDGRPHISVNKNYKHKIEEKEDVIKLSSTEQFVIGDDTVIYDKETGLWKIK